MTLHVTLPSYWGGSRLALHGATDDCVRRSLVRMVLEGASLRFTGLGVGGLGPWGQASPSHVTSCEQVSISATGSL